MKRKGILAIGCFVVVLIMIVAICWPRDYEVSYEVDGYDVIERFDKEMGHYFLSIELDDVIYSMPLESKQLGSKHLVKSVSVVTDDEATCVLMKGDKILSYPVCRDGEKYVDYSLSGLEDDEFYEREKIDKTNEEYEGVSILGDLGKSYYVWDYKGYYRIADKKSERIEFFSKESYYNKLAISTEEYLLTPNYDEDYVFTEIFVINMKNGKLSSWKLKEEISFNTYCLGVKDGLVYIVDRKNKAEYELDPKRKRIERIDEKGTGRVWNGEWSEVSMTKLVDEDYSFEIERALEYMLDDKTLILKEGKRETIASEKRVDKIVTVDGDKVFYLVKDELFSYSPLYGENVVLKWSELGFNDVNSIFVY